MLSDNTPLTGTREEKVIQCLKKAGWYSGRKSDIADVENYYSARGITLTEPQKDIFREFYGIAESWYFNYDGDLGRRGPDFEFYLMPGNAPELYQTDELEDPDHEWYDLDFVRYMKDLKQAAGERPIYIGEIGYYYPSWCYADSNGRLWALIGKCEDIRSYDNMISLIEDHFSHPERWSSVRMCQHLITKK